jgi:hypothetical protein
VDEAVDVEVLAAVVVVVAAVDVADVTHPDCSIHKIAILLKNIQVKINNRKKKIFSSYETS